MNVDFAKNNSFRIELIGDDALLALMGTADGDMIDMYPATGEKLAEIATYDQVTKFLSGVRVDLDGDDINDFVLSITAKGDEEDEEKAILTVAVTELNELMFGEGELQFTWKYETKGIFGPKSNVVNGAELKFNIQDFLEEKITLKLTITRENTAGGKLEVIFEDMQITEELLDAVTPKPEPTPDPEPTPTPGPEQGTEEVEPVDPNQGNENQGGGTVEDSVESDEVKTENNETNE